MLYNALKHREKGLRQGHELTELRLKEFVVCNRDKELADFAEEVCTITWLVELHFVVGELLHDRVQRDDAHVVRVAVFVAVAAAVTAALAVPAGFASAATITITSATVVIR